MGKQEQLIEYIVQDIVDMFSSDQDIEYDEAMTILDAVVTSALVG